MRLYDREKKKESKLDRESRTARERVCVTVRESVSLSHGALVSDKVCAQRIYRCTKSTSQSPWILGCAQIQHTLAHTLSLISSYRQYCVCN